MLIKRWPAYSFLTQPRKGGPLKWALYVCTVQVDGGGYENHSVGGMKQKGTLRTS